ncbi:MAG: metallophosphoesterase [Bacteroidetes bacterium]|nr:metallophosphoesterase [Bacteroidota bacterium]
MKNLIVLLIILHAISHQSAGQSNETDFSFIFMTDMHWTPERGGNEAFQMAIDTANRLGADFVMTGGDLVYDVLRGNYEKSEQLFNGYKEAIKAFNLPVYNCIGNHELFAIYEESPEDSTHQDYKYGMYERHFGDTYYSFDHKGWHFIVLNSLEVRGKRYIGMVNEEQIDWLKKDLAKVDKMTPIAVTVHIPLVTTYKQIYPKKPITEVPNNLYVYNRKEVLDAFVDHNLKLVLQGHMHWIEDLNIQGRTRFITGGSIAGRPSWRRVDDRGDGQFYNEEGFMHIFIKGQEIEWKYIDIGWEARVGKR